MTAPPSPPLPFPVRANDAHKGDVGKVLLVGGSRGMSGAIALSSIASLKTGSGLVTTAVPDRCLEAVAAHHPGVMTVPLKEDACGCFDVQATLPSLLAFDAIGIGPGMRTHGGSISLVEAVWLHVEKNRVLDADAINVVAQQRWLEGPRAAIDQSSLVLTPHPGELARLTGVPADHREAQLRAVTALVDRFGMTIVVKGGPTQVVAPGHRYTNPTGNPGMATAGSGDVLTGVITSLLGQGLSPWDAARLGVFLHGLAGDMAAKAHGQAGMTCWELLQHLPEAIRKIASAQDPHSPECER